MPLKREAKGVAPIPDTANLEYLRWGTIVELLPVLLAFSWLAGLRALRFGGRLDSLPVAVILLVGDSEKLHFIEKIQNLHVYLDVDSASLLSAGLC